MPNISGFVFLLWKQEKETEGNGYRSSMLLKWFTAFLYSWFLVAWILCSDSGHRATHSMQEVPEGTSNGFCITKSFEIDASSQEFSLITTRRYENSISWKILWIHTVLYLRQRWGAITLAVKDNTQNQEIQIETCMDPESEWMRQTSCLWESLRGLWNWDSEHWRTELREASMKWTPWEQSQGQLGCNFIESNHWIPACLGP